MPLVPRRARRLTRISPARSIEHRATTNVRRAEVDFLRLPRRRTISRAVVGSAQVRAALDDAAWRVAGGQRQTRSSGSRANDAATPTKILLNAGIGTLTRDARRMTLALHPPCDDSEALSVRRTQGRLRERDTTVVRSDTDNRCRGYRPGH